MKCRVVTEPLSIEPEDLLRMIESDPEAFAVGRRNNDMVNWFIAKRLVEQAASHLEDPFATLRKCLLYKRDFHYLMEAASKEQLHSILDWDMDPDEKIRRLHQAYGRVNAFGLSYIWLAMDYAVPVRTGRPKTATTTASGKD